MSCTKEIDFNKINTIKEYPSEEKAKKALALDLSLFAKVFKINDTLKEGFEYERVNKILNNICISNNISPCPRLKIFDTNRIVVPYATHYTLVMSKGLIQNIKSDDELAFILGHELTHILFGHTKIVDTDFIKGLKYMLYNVDINPYLEPSMTFLISLDPSEWLAANLLTLIYVPLTGMITTEVFQRIESSLYIFNREMEYQADINSIKLMKKSHYDTKASISFWNTANDIFQAKK